MYIWKRIALTLLMIVLLLTAVAALLSAVIFAGAVK